MTPEGVVQYAIYDHPIDYPEHWVVREWKISAGSVEAGPARIANSLEEARAMLPPGVEIIDTKGLGATGTDDPKLVEVWM